MVKPQQVEVYPDVAALSVAAGQRFLQLAQAAVARHSVFTVALAGGSTPRGLYTALATDPHLRAAIPWARIHFFFGDERHVPPGHPDSNFRMADEAMFQRLPREWLHVHRLPGELPDPAEAADIYAAEMRRFFEAQGLMEDEFPRFDLVLLGMGPDGHTASLFHGTPALQETRRWVVANWVEKLKTHRITMTLPVLNRAAGIIMLVAGAEKAPILAEVLELTAPEPKYPVQMVQPVKGTKRWMLDKAAAAELTAVQT